MAAFILSPERWRELSATSSPVAVVDGQQQTPQAGPGIRRRISRVFYEAHHTPGNSFKIILYLSFTAFYLVMLRHKEMTKIIFIIILVIIILIIIIVQPKMIETAPPYSRLPSGRPFKRAQCPSVAHFSTIGTSEIIFMTIISPSFPSLTASFLILCRCGKFFGKSPTFLYL